MATTTAAIVTKGSGESTSGKGNELVSTAVKKKLVSFRFPQTRLPLLKERGLKYAVLGPKNNLLVNLTAFVMPCVYACIAATITMSLFRR